jgi:NTE family protein
VSEEPFLRPDVLVLAAGGAVGEAWMTGVLAGLEEATGIDFRTVDAFVGTSAGAIVGASLAAGRSPRRPPGTSPRPGGGGAMPTDPARRRGGPLPDLAGVWGRAVWAASAPLAGPALALGAPVGARARSLLLARVSGEGASLDGLRRHIDGRGQLWDGRLRVCTVDRETGRRVVFGRPRSPKASVGEAVSASCAVPWIFRPVRIGGREYVDGGVWSLTNLDAAPAGRDTEVLCLSVTASLPLALNSPLSLMRAASRSAEAVETLALRRRGASVRTIGPDHEAADALGPNLMDDRRRASALAAGYRQGLRLGRV